MRGKRNKLTAPAQNISEGHHACLGGNATCEGKVWLSEAVATGLAVATVKLGTAVDSCGLVAVAEETDEGAADVRAMPPRRDKADIAEIMI